MWGNLEFESMKGYENRKTMFCINCGNQVPENGKFCMRCGTKISESHSGNKTTLSDNFIQRSQVAQTSVGNITISPTISPVINVGTLGAEKCPSCGGDYSKQKLKECRNCHKKYCILCEINGIACPNCGLPYKSLRKMRCGACKQIFAITQLDKKSIDDLDADEIYSVKQRCKCPVCGRTMYYSGDIGFEDLGEYTLFDILDDHNNNAFFFVTLNKFRTK